MIDEQIKTEIARQVDQYFEKFATRVNPIENIIANSKYYVLTFSGSPGQTTLVSLNPDFDLGVLSQGSNMLIKSIKFIPYARDATIDAKFSDGTTQTTPALMRLERIPEGFTDSMVFEIRINGQTINMVPFDLSGDRYVPLDFNVDNIYSLFKGKIQNFGVFAQAQVFTDWDGATLSHLYQVVLIECYLF